MGRRDFDIPSAGVPFALALGVLALSAAGSALASDPGDITAWWPASGLALAGLVLVPGVSRPRLVVAVLVGSVAGRLLDEPGVLLGLGLGAATTAEAVLAAEAIRRAAAAGPRFDEPLRLFAILGLAVVGADAVGAVLGGGLDALDAGPSFPVAWARWLLADTIGMLLVLPAVAAWRPGRSSRRVPRAERAAITIVLLATTGLVFGRDASAGGLVALPYLCLPPLLWAALRCGVRGATAAALALGGGAIVFTGRGDGPFAVARDVWVRVLNAQLFVIATAVAALLAAVVVDRRRRDDERLHRSNQDLERYAAAVSHDLVVPMRSIEGYVDLLERNSEASLDADGRHLLEALRASAAHLRRQVLGLLELARAGTRLELEAVPVRALMDRVLLALDDELHRTGAEVEVGWLPHVIADPAQLELVFGNLLANALKFHDGAPPRVSVQARRLEGAWCFAITDDGAGIDPEEAERIFAHGFRGRDAAAVGGSGVGLAIVRRAVEAHGGQIWATRRPEGGTRFEFVLPAEP